MTKKRVFVTRTQKNVTTTTKSPARRKTVTGRTYDHTRPRGLAPWAPQGRTRELLVLVGAILDEYSDHLPLSGRQVFYRLVGKYGYDKTEDAYERLTEKLNRARRAGLVPWDAIRDDGTTAVHAGGFTGPRSFWAYVRRLADHYQRDLSTGQPITVELWVEAAGMVPQIARVAANYGLSVYSSGGFDSVTGKHEAAERMLVEDHRRRVHAHDDVDFLGVCIPSTVVLHIGDFDPSGCSIIDSAAEDVSAFCADHGSPGIVEFRRIVVTPEQIARYDLPTAPQKAGDRRGEAMAETVQAEALSPDELAAEVTAAIEAVVDLGAIAEAEAAGKDERKDIQAVLGRIGKGIT